VLEFGAFSFGQMHHVVLGIARFRLGQHEKIDGWQTITTKFIDQPIDGIPCASEQGISWTSTGKFPGAT
jgi:hypothetical protein